VGTNFYLNGPDPDEDSPKVHIGKRSYAGAYCWDCGISFAVNGTQQVHFANSAHDYTRCPECGGEGGGASSFTWTKMAHLRDLQDLRGYNAPVVVDEYGTTYTADEFLDEELSGVPACMNFQLAGRFC
jgi:hypothetical protein